MFATLLIGLFAFVLPPVLIGGWVLWKVLDEIRGPRVPILMYHRFLDAKKVDSGEIVDPERVWVVLDRELDDHCRALAAAGYQSVNFDELLDGFAGRSKLPEKPVVLTFDDGYSSCWDLAHPVLQRHGMKGVFYVAVEPDEHTRELVAGLDGFLSDEQMRAMAAAGHTIASHTMTHGLLSEMSDDEIRWELSESKKRLEAVIGAPVEHFCIPRAGGNRRVVRLIGEAGYKTSTGADKGSATPRRDPLRLPRIGVARDTTGARLVQRLQPLTAAKERVLADIRLIPTRILGPRAGYQLRQVLYGGPIRRALLQDRLGAVLAVVALVYAGLGVAWLAAVAG